MKTETEKFEVKFRAWDGKGMIYRGLHDRNWYTEEKGGKVVFGAHPDDKHQLEVMQFINKKDIHKNDLYQGDIVRWGIMENGLETLIRYAVIEINPDIQFRILFYINPETNERVETDGKVFNYGNFMYQRTELYLEKLGNIHQNPELLNVKKP
jgi:hypothetical protein